MRNIIKLALVGLLSVSTIVVAAESSPEALRIGYQKGSIGMVLAKSHQLLENAIRNQKSRGWSSPLARKCLRR